MRKIYFALLFVSGLILTSCDSKETELQFEKDVMYEVYPALIDSVWVNALQYYIPPPPPQVKDTPEYRIQQRKKYKKQFNQDLADLKKRKFPVDLVFLDKAIVRNNPKELQEHFKDAIISKKKSSDTLNYKFDRKKLDAYKTFHIKYVPRIPRGEDRKFYNECCYTVRGVISFSRIQFDSKKKYGVLTAGIECGAMCGYGYRIYIKKEKNKWVVDKIEDAWIV